MDEVGCYRDPYIACGADSILLAAPILFGKDQPSYDKGLLMSTESSACGIAEKGGKMATAEIVGTDAFHKQPQPTAVEK
jgi:hypothetical protein